MGMRSAREMRSSTVTQQWLPTCMTSYSKYTCWVTTLQVEKLCGPLQSRAIATSSRRVTVRQIPDEEQTVPQGSTRQGRPLLS
jgi:hypothetical protein